MDYFIFQVSCLQMLDLKWPFPRGICTFCLFTTGKQSARMAPHLLGCLLTLLPFCLTCKVNPPYYVPLVELVPHPETAPATVDRTHALMQKIGQSPVRVLKEIDGFALNRLQYAIISEAWRLVEVRGTPPASGCWRGRGAVCPAATWVGGRGVSAQSCLFSSGDRGPALLSGSVNRQGRRNVMSQFIVRFSDSSVTVSHLIVTPDDRLLCFLPFHVITT